MHSLGKLLVAVTVLVSAVGLLVLPQFAAPASQQNGTQSSDEPAPAFHAQAPKDALPPTMEASLFQDVQTFNAYLVAGRIKKVLYQQPCYCHCDRSQGHTSLLDCFTGRHAAVCGTCVREDFYSYEQSQKGKTPAQIREGIERGDWEKLDVTRYQSPLPVK